MPTEKMMVEQGGFTLIEVVVAMVVLAVGLLGLEALGIRAAQSLALADRQSGYAVIASDSLESGLHQLRNGAIPPQFCQEDPAQACSTQGQCGADACVAYADTGGAWVVAGGPIAAPEREAAVMERFADAAREAGRRVRFFALEERPPPSFRALPIGEQPIWDPQDWPAALARKRSLREQLRRARAKGVTVRLVAPEEVAAPDHPTRRSIDEMIAHWQDTRKMAPMGFVVHLDPYNLPEERRFFIAEHDGHVVGILIAVPIYARDGWFFEDVLRDPKAPNGTVELMFDHTLHCRPGVNDPAIGLDADIWFKPKPEEPISSKERSDSWSIALAEKYGQSVTKNCV